jgi:ABC-type multidrug transport system fused ATPase/permease subunit
MTTQRLIDGAVAADNSAIARNAVALAALIAVGYVIARVSGSATARFSSGAARDIKRGVAEALADADYSELMRVSAGDALSAVNSDTNTVAEFLSGDMINLFSQAVMAAGAIAYLLFTDPLLMAVTFAYTPLGMFFTLTLNARMNRLYPVRADRAGEALSTVEQALTQIPVIKSFVMEARTRRRVEASCCGVLDAEMKIAKSDALIQPACSSTSAIPRILFFLYAGALVMRGEMTLGAFVAILDLLNYIVGPSVYFPFLMNGLNRAVASVNRVRRLEELPRAAEAPDTPRAPSVAIRDLEFSYIPGAPVLRGVSFEFKKPGIVALSGGSGRGKTTLLDLLAGLLRPDGGELTVTGTVAAMEQEPYLFEREAERGNANATLSGGQKQKAAFERVKRSGASVWLLDEPTASLDADSERELLGTLERERSRRLIIISSHKQAALDIADATLDLGAPDGKGDAV